MKKKIIAVIAAVALVAVLAIGLVACNDYKWDSIGAGEPDAAVESNGGYAVKQGKFVYYLNGYEGTDAANEWGQPTLQTIVRSELKDGKIDNATTKTVVPKSIYNGSANGGFAIFKDWIYYATPNYDKDDSGTPSTTHTDFMRTKIDGSVTQRLGKINSRSAEYIFTETRVLYYLSNTISYIDFSGIKTNKSSDSPKGIEKGNIAENVANVVWAYGCKEIFYVQNLTGSDSYKNYNKLYAVGVDGSNNRLLATENTFLAENEKPVENPMKVFKYTLKDLFVEADGSATIYYTKSYTLDGTATDTGLYCAKAADFKGSEKKLNDLASNTMFPLGYADGALAYGQDGSHYIWYNGENAGTPLAVIKKDQKIWKVDPVEGVAYVTASSSVSELYKIAYKTVGNPEVIIKEGMKVDWLKLDFVGDDLFFFATSDNNMMHYVNVKTFDKDAKDAKSEYAGFVRDEDE